MVKGHRVSGEDDKGELIVVGVDVSESSQHALQWAVRHARRTGGVVQAVMAWNYPPYTGIAQMTDTFDYAAHAASVLLESVRETVGERPSVEVSTSVVQGDPAHVLVDASRSADLLVVGTGGHSGFAEALLGSVGQHCTHHASCPVVVVRKSDDVG
jgi:nucleotide-binding universal stress UspA family protein